MFHQTVKKVQGCTLCQHQLSHGVRPVLQVNAKARILVAGQAPGAKVHASGVPFDDLSGNRLREWMGISNQLFYDSNTVAILPMSFCYPGTGKSGDLPPMPICSDTWRNELLDLMPNIQLTLAIGQYAQKWHIEKPHKNLTETVKNYQSYDQIIPLPHPSPRNNIWLKKNPWFEEEVLPFLQQKIHQII